MPRTNVMDMNVVKLLGVVCCHRLAITVLPKSVIKTFGLFCSSHFWELQEQSFAINGQKGIGIQARQARSNLLLFMEIIGI